MPSPGSNRRHTPQREMDDDLRDRKIANANFKKDCLIEFYDKIEDLENEWLASWKLLLEEAALQRKRIWLMKEAYVGAMECRRKHERKEQWKNALCSVDIATLVGEFIAGPMGETDYWRHETRMDREIYAFALAIRVDGVKWPYMTYHAMKIVGKLTIWWEDGEGMTRYQKIARPLIGEMCRLSGMRIPRKIARQRMELPVWRAMRGGPISVNAFLYEGLSMSSRGIEWFERYLQNPIYEESFSRWWHRQLLEGVKPYSWQLPKVDPLVKLLDCAFAETQAYPEPPALKSWIPRKH